MTTFKNIHSVVKRIDKSLQHKNKKLAVINGDEIKITFPFNYNTLKDVKTLDGRMFNGKNPRDKYWTCPTTPDNIQSLKDFGFTIQGDLEIVEKKIQNPLINIDGFEAAYPFQKEGWSFAINHKGRALIGDEMGLGKTLQALAVAKYYGFTAPALVICPASLKENWKREAIKWLGIPENFIQIIHGKKPIEIHGKIKIVIANYDIIHRTEIVKVKRKGENKFIQKIFIRKDLESVSFSTVILDECHSIKNSKAKRTKAVKLLSKNSEHFIALSGTPIINRPSEFFNVLNILDSKTWNSFWNYAHMYCGAKHNGFGWDFNGSSNLNKLNQKVQNYMIRRKKLDVLSDLPNKIRTVIPLEIKNFSEYSEAEADLIQWIRRVSGENSAEKAKNSEKLIRFEKLKQLAVRGKIHGIEEWMENYFDSNKKLLIFCEHRNDPFNCVEIISNMLDNLGIKSVSCVGGDTDKDKKIHAFNNDESVRALIGTRSIIEGHSVTSTSNVCFVELWWTPGQHDQAEDRVYGIARGDGSYQVNSYYFVAKNTIEEEIINMLDSKRKVIDSAVDGIDTEDLDLLSELFEKYSQENLK